jgi:hypothetical protein
MKKIAQLIKKVLLSSIFLENAYLLIILSFLGIVIFRQANLFLPLIIFTFVIILLTSIKKVINSKN